MSKDSHGILLCAIAQLGANPTPDDNNSITGVNNGEIFVRIGEYPTNKHKQLLDTVTMLLRRIPTRENHKRVLTQTLYHFQYKVSGDLCFICVTKPEFPVRIVFAFLDDLETQFLRQRPEHHSTNLKNLLKSRMAHFNNPENDKISKLQGKIDDTKSVMIENIEKVLARGESLERLVDITEQLEEDSKYFRVGAKKLKNKMWWKNLSLVVMILFVLLLAIFSIIWLSCGFPNFYRCHVKRK
jgi:vesicle-associated membrane protein 7